MIVPTLLKCNTKYMKSNSLLTYVLYGLLGLFILSAGYYACDKQKKEKELAAREAAELQETLVDLGYASEDTTGNGSSYVGSDSSSSKSVSKTGIEDDPTPTKPTATKPITTPATKPATKPAVTTKPSTPASPKPIAQPGTTQPKTVAGPGTGRWAVRAGTFAYMDGARRRLEQVIKAGYTNAEISKTSDGKAAVVVFRSNDKNAAIRIADQLESKGIDAAVFDRNK